MTDQNRLSPDRLLDFATAVYAGAGMPQQDARLAADTLVQADLWGHQSHGVMRLSWYVGAFGPASATRSPSLRSLSMLAPSR